MPRVKALDAAALVPGKGALVTINGQDYVILDSIGSSTFSIGADGKLSKAGEEIGFLKVYRNGDWSFEQTNNAESSEQPVFNFSYRVEDADGDYDTGDFSVQATYFRPASFEDETAIVDEDGLPNGDYDDPEGPTNDGTDGDNIGGHQINNQPDPATEAVFRNTLGIAVIPLLYPPDQLARLVHCLGRQLAGGSIEFPSPVAHRAGQRLEPGCDPGNGRLVGHQGRAAKRPRGTQHFRCVGPVISGDDGLEPIEAFSCLEREEVGGSQRSVHAASARGCGRTDGRVGSRPGVVNEPGRRGRASPSPPPALRPSRRPGSPG